MRPTGAATTVRSPAAPEPIRASLKFDVYLVPGEVRVRFRSMPLNAGTLPGAWSISKPALQRLAAPSQVQNGGFCVDGLLKVAIGALADATCDYALFASGSPASVDARPVFTARSTPTLNTSLPASVSTGRYSLYARCVGKENTEIDSEWAVVGSPLLLGTPTNIRIKHEAGRVTISWEAVENAEAYLVRVGDMPPRKVEAQYPLGPVPTSLVITSDQFTPGKAYRASVQATAERAYGEVSSGPWSASGEIPREGEEWTSQLAYANNHLSASWPPSAGTARYDVIICEFEAGQEPVVPVKVLTTIPVTPLHGETAPPTSLWWPVAPSIVKGKRYTAYVQTIARDGQPRGDWHSLGSAVVLDAPPNVRLGKIGQGNMGICWDGVEGADGYRVDVLLKGGNQPSKSTDLPAAARNFSCYDVYYNIFGGARAKIMVRARSGDYHGPCSELHIRQPRNPNPPWVWQTDPDPT
jgi:hypothetical protein